MKNIPRKRICWGQFLGRFRLQVLINKPFIDVFKVLQKYQYDISGALCYDWSRLVRVAGLKVNLFIYLFNEYLDRIYTSVTIVTAISVCPV